jgi:hypothetical protein
MMPPAPANTLENHPVDPRPVETMIPLELWFSVFPP